MVAWIRSHRFFFVFLISAQFVDVFASVRGFKKGNIATTSNHITDGPQRPINKGLGVGYMSPVTYNPTYITSNSYLHYE
jgi:hypothetical protein